VVERLLPECQPVEGFGPTLLRCCGRTARYDAAELPVRADDLEDDVATVDAGHGDEGLPHDVWAYGGGAHDRGGHRDGEVVGAVHLDGVET
jgi:hypothetical protein